MIRRLGCAIAVCLAATSAAAQDGLIGLQYGEHDSYSRTGLTVRLDEVWATDFGKWRAAVHPEFELSRFTYSGRRGVADTLDEGAAVALLRFGRQGTGLRPYVEVGLGGALFSRDDFGGKAFGQRLQFVEHVGAGVAFGRWSAGWRYSHYSNADLAKPNDGLDLHQLFIGARF